MRLTRLEWELAEVVATCVALVVLLPLATFFDELAKAGAKAIARRWER